MPSNTPEGKPSSGEQQETGPYTDETPTTAADAGTNLDGDSAEYAAASRSTSYAAVEPSSCAAACTAACTAADTATSCGADAAACTTASAVAEIPSSSVAACAAPRNGAGTAICAAASAAADTAVTAAAFATSDLPSRAALTAEEDAAPDAANDGALSGAAVAAEYSGQVFSLQCCDVSASTFSNRLSPMAAGAPCDAADPQQRQQRQQQQQQQQQQQRQQQEQQQHQEQQEGVNLRYERPAVMASSDSSSSPSVCTSAATQTPESSASQGKGAAASNAYSGSWPLPLQALEPAADSAATAAAAAEGMLVGSPAPADSAAIAVAPAATSAASPASQQHAAVCNSRNSCAGILLEPQVCSAAAGQDAVDLSSMVAVAAGAPAAATPAAAAPAVAAPAAIAAAGAPAVAAPAAIAAEGAAPANASATVCAAGSGAADAPAAVAATGAGAADAPAAAAASAASELRALRALVESLKAENQRLKEALAPTTRSTPPVQQGDGATAAAAAATGEFSCLPAQLQDLGEEKKQQTSSVNAEGATANNPRKGRAPGPPPNTRGPPGRPRVTAASGAGAPPPGDASISSSTENSGKNGSTKDNAMSLWGWRPANEPLSSLRSCCADRLLLGCCCCSENTSSSTSSSSTSCSSTSSGSTSSSSSSGAEGDTEDMLSLPAVTAGPLEASWLLQLEEAVHCTLVEQQQQQQQQHHQQHEPSVPPSTLHREAARAALKTVVEEIGFSVLDVEQQQQHETVDSAVVGDPRLFEWFVRPSVSSSSSLSLLSSHARGEHTPAPADSKENSKNAVLSRAEKERRQAATLPPSLRKSISISLSALRRGCADRLNFCRRLQSDLLQCSLSPSALELLLELVPDLTKANDKRQLWLEARDALSRQSVCMRRLLDDEESFAAFVFQFDALHQRLELLSFLNSKTMEAYLSSLLQIQVKLDCLAMLRRRAPRIGQCVRAAALAASVVSGLSARKNLNDLKTAAADEGAAKENAEPTATNKCTIKTETEERKMGKTDGTAKEENAGEPDAQKCSGLTMFRWPMLFERIKKQYGFAPDGSLDKSRSLLKVLATHTGRPLDTTELTLLKRASQKPLVVLLEQEASLVYLLLLLHRAAVFAATSRSIPETQTAEQQQQVLQDPMKALAARLLQCCHRSSNSSSRSCGSVSAGGAAGSAVAEDSSNLKRQREAETGDLLLSVIPKLVMSHKGRLKTLTRLAAQLLREYAAFVCWLGDRGSFLPLQLNLHESNSKQEAPWGPQGPSLPAVLAAVVPAAPPQRRPAAAKPQGDAFERLYSFLEELEKNAEPAATTRPTRKHLLERRCCSSSSRSSSPSSSSSSLPLLSPGSSPERRKQQKTKYATDASYRTTAATTAARCFALPGILNGAATPAPLRSLLSRGTSYQLRPTKIPAGAAAAAAPAEGNHHPALVQLSRGNKSSSSSCCCSSLQPSVVPSVQLPPHLRLPLSALSPPGAAAAAAGSPLNLPRSPLPTNTSQGVSSVSADCEQPHAPQKNTGERLRSPAAPTASWRGVCTPQLEEDATTEAAHDSGRQQRQMLSATTNIEAGTDGVRLLLSTEWRPRQTAPAANPSDFCRNSLASVFCSRSAFTSGVRISLNKVPVNPKQHQHQQQTQQQQHQQQRGEEERSAAEGAAQSLCIP